VAPAVVALVAVSVVAVMVTTPLVAGAATGAAATSAAATSAPAPPAALSVTSPAEPVDATPGTPATTILRVGNLGPGPLPVQITSEGVQLLDNGKTRFGQPTDPRFAGRIHIDPSALTIQARQKATVEITVDTPGSLRPDDYFLGFLVTPILNAPSVAVVNQVGALVVLDVPGPRLRKLTATAIGPPRVRFTFGRSATGIVRVKNVGEATVPFSATTETQGWPAASQPYRTEPRQVLPPGLSRDTPLHITTPFGLGWYTIRTTLVYNLTDQTTGQVVVSRRVLIINPLLALPVVLLLAALVWRRHRKQEVEKTGLRAR
jgi:hypothetical protein